MSRRMEKHVKAVGLLHIGLAVVHLLAATTVFLALTGASLFTGDVTAIFLSGSVAAVIAAFLVLTSLPGLAGGIGILQRRSWARWLILIVAAFNILEFPFGTAVGIYTFWALLSEESGPLFAG